MNVDKDKMIEMLKNEIQEQKRIIKKLTEENLILKNKGRNDMHVTEPKEENVRIVLKRRSELQQRTSIKTLLF